MSFRLNTTWLAVTFILVTLLLCLHLYALHTLLYWHLRWFDIPMHILGGAALGSLLLTFGVARNTVLYFFCMCVVVVGWEVFEYVGGISTGQADYWFDTSKDIIDGLFGSVIAFLIYKKSSWR